MKFPSHKINTDISPTDFELLVKEYLTEVGQNLKSFSATHDINIKTLDGEYQIDIYAEFEFLGAVFKVLIECKRHKNKIKREVVQVLFDKLRATGTQKAMVFSTSGFQEGAITFAAEHGIALVQVIEGKYTFFTKSNGSQNFDPPEWMDIPKYVGEYINENSISYLQKGYVGALENFLFGEDSASS